MNIKRSAALIMIAVLLLCGLSGCKDGQDFDSVVAFQLLLGIFQLFRNPDTSVITQ